MPTVTWSRRLLGTGVAMDEGMIYFDARPSAPYPTVEVRIADVCLEVRDTVLVAALARALVETAAREWASGIPAVPAPVSILRLATWQASRYGLREEASRPNGAPAPPGQGSHRRSAGHVAPALRDAGDEVEVERRLLELYAGGTGADRQRAAFAATGRLDRAVIKLAESSCPPAPEIGRRIVPGVGSRSCRALGYRAPWVT